MVRSPPPSSNHTVINGSPRFIDGIGEIHRDAARLSLNILLNVIARGGCRARETVLKALSDYYAAGGYAYASRLIRDRHVVHEEYQIPQADTERFDTALSFGLLANSVPIAFWAIYYMYSDASLLAEVREGIDAVVRTSSIGSRTSSEHEKLVIKVNIKVATGKYPLLRSFVSEVLRLQTTNVSPRIVQENTIIGGRHLLKKGNIVMMPSAAAHRDPNSWGTLFLEVRCGVRESPSAQIASAYYQSDVLTFSRLYVLCNATVRPCPPHIPYCCPTQNLSPTTN